MKYNDYGGWEFGGNLSVFELVLRFFSVLRCVFFICKILNLFYYISCYN